MKNDCPLTRQAEMVNDEAQDRADQAGLTVDVLYVQSSVSDKYRSNKRFTILICRIAHRCSVECGSDSLLKPFSAVER